MMKNLFLLGRTWDCMLRNLIGVCIGAALASQAGARSLLFDFGGADDQTALPPVTWNNLTEDIGSTFFGNLELVDTQGEPTGLEILIDQLFDETPNTSGNSDGSGYPGSVSSDSLTNESGEAGIAIIGTEGSGETYTLTFFASDTSVSDNRETRYEVEGDRVESVTLNPSGNTNETATIVDMGLDEFGEIIVTLTPGSEHTPENDVVYIGALEIESSSGWRALIDFGALGDETTLVFEGETTQWNNFQGDVGQTDDGVFEGVVSTDGVASDIRIQMLSRFNGVNEAGALDSELYPGSATGDSLFGNIEEFGGLTDVRPSFLIQGLDQKMTYDLVFYASRIAGDNRETLYTITGVETSEVSLNVAGNISELAMASGLTPNSAGEIQVDISPGPNNNNANRFIYLGVLELRAPNDGKAYLFDFGGGNITEFDVETEPEGWNNVEESVGLSDSGSMGRLLNTEFVRTDIGFEMVARFNGVNRAGSRDSTVLPASATGDSLFGNTEIFGGRENVFPSFKLTGLDPGVPYTFTFYGSREATDNRETMYTVTGSNSNSGALNAAGNIDNTVSVAGVIPNESREILLEIGPGPNNDNGNHFTYLGAMRVDWEPAFEPRVLIDAGGTNFETTTDDSGAIWNNFQIGVAGTNDGTLDGLLAVNGRVTPFGIQMLSRFNGVNEAGTTEPAPYPITATQDSLFGNTEEWSGLTDIFPSFQITGLDPEIEYDLTFYASRNATDNRETQYTVIGANEKVVFLNVAGNIDNEAIADSMTPNSDGVLTVQIEPGPNNDNGNHFTYLGALRIDWTGGLPSNQQDASIENVALIDGALTFTVNGGPDQTYNLLSSSNLRDWEFEDNVTVGASGSTIVTIAVDRDMKFFRFEQ